MQKSGPIFSRESIPVNLSPSIRSVNLHNIVTPLLHFIQGSIVILENQISGCQVHVFRVFEEIWICFRGTQVKDIASMRKDMKTDLNFRQRSTCYLPEDNQVHRGFDESYMSVRDEIRHEVERVFTFEGDRPLRIIGHSLGGALGTLAALDFRTNMTFAKTISVRTFGSPCVGNKAFVENFNEQLPDSKRYTIYMDPVPMLLSEISAFGYLHVDQWIQMNEQRRKHNVLYYIKVLCRYANVDDDIEEEVDEPHDDIDEEEIFYTTHNNQNIKLLLIGTSLLVLAVPIYKYLYKK